MLKRHFTQMCRPNKAQNDRGAVLLTTLLIMTLMAVLAIALIEDIGFAIKRRGHLQAYAQADWYAASAEDFAIGYLQSEFSNLPRAQVNQKLNALQPFTLPIDRGVLTIRVRDGSSCYALNRLKDAPARQEFENLLIELGVNSFKAQTLSFIARDWMDPDNDIGQNGAEDFVYLIKEPAHRTANADFSSVMELRSLNTMDEATYQRIRPFICARPAESNNRININSLTPAHIPLLNAVLGGGDENQAIAARIITQRPDLGYNNLAQIRELFDEDEALLQASALSTLSFFPSHIWVEVEIIYGQARRVLSMEFAINNQEISRISRFQGDEGRRPLPKIIGPNGGLNGL